MQSLIIAKPIEVAYWYTNFRTDPFEAEQDSRIVQHMTCLLWTVATSYGDYTGLSINNVCLQPCIVVHVCFLLIVKTIVGTGEARCHEIAYQFGGT